MKTIQRIITAVTLAAVMICMASTIKAKADVIEASEVIANNVAGADLTSIAYAYTNLTSQQKYIADYCMGAFNYSYMCARGFSFDIDQTETNMKAQLGAIGSRIWQFLTTEYGWKSRFNETFRQYASSIIIYASKQTGTFNDWITDILNGNKRVFIEYTADAFDAWTEFYNDPSGDGIASFGDVTSPWDSGTSFDFAYIGYAWDNSTSQTIYNNFILNYNPIFYTNDTWYQYSNNAQFVISPNGYPLPNSLYILNNTNSHNSYRFGFAVGETFVSYNYKRLRVDIYNPTHVISVPFNAETYSWTSEIVNVGGSHSGSEIIDIAFDRTPFYFNSKYHGYYPYITHVYMVDDLSTLSNPVEIFNTESFNIIPPGMPDFIITPNGKMLIPGYAPMTDPFADLWDVSVDVNGDTVTEDDFNTQIVNNTVINNYTIDASDKINVPVDWFDNELSDQLANDSIPFLSFARDCIDCLGDLQLYFYGAIVFGLGGGVLKKLLL